MEQTNNEIVFVPDPLKLLELQSLEIPLNFQLYPNTSTNTNTNTNKQKENSNISCNQKKRIASSLNSKDKSTTFSERKNKFHKVYADLYTMIHKHKKREKQIFGEFMQNIDVNTKAKNLIKRRKEYLQKVYGEDRKLENLYSPQQIKRILLRRKLSKKTIL
ncbi:hypothetical protein M0813_16782 [Anaeramoeba flamelloides]|uniref:Uncharacterized protein n=1 Tax=Anaeramoeba flamelloides TaxID=1746091 RepID=A0ABQ8YYJ1_9EUKA|nr:hypothetical protein M0813_16782 [Anaeramoeba flamelloides]